MDKDGLWHLGEGEGTAKSLTGGIITGGDLCGVDVNQNGTFNMYSGNIVGNTSSSGGGVSNNGTFNLYDGFICYNFSTGSGGGVSNNGTFNFYDGSICYNVATADGGGVSNTSGTFTMKGGIIIGNNATNGGGLYSSLTPAINVLTGGVITENKATNGGGVYYKAEECFAKGTLITMADGTQKPIETLSKGESVRVFDHETGTISSSKLFDVWSYPEKHSGVVELCFSNNVKVTIVYGHSFFNREQNKYVAITKDNVSSFVGHQFYNVDNARWETLEGYNFIDGKVDTYVITTEYQLNCVANGMLTNEDGFYTIITNVFEYGDNLKIDQVKKAQDIANFGIYEYENIKHMSKYAYDVLNAQYMKVAFGKGLISESEFNYLEAYYASLDPELYCSDKQSEVKQTKKSLMKAPLMAPLTSAPTTPTTAGIYLGGSIKIIDNTSGNLYLSSGKIITIGTGTADGGNGVALPTNDMLVGITLEDGIGNFATGVSTDEYLDCFTSDNEIYSVKAKNETTYAYSIVHEHEEESIYFDKAWTNKNSLPTTAGNYVLTCDITLTATWTVPEDTTNLCLNGHVINANGGAFSAITVGENAILNLYDCGDTKHNGYVDSTGLWHYDSTGTHELLEGETAKTITGGIITGGNPNGTDENTKKNQAGGGVYVGKGEFNMYGGTIAGNEAKSNGGGVFVASGGKFTMSAGEIKFNKASSGGGAATQSGTIAINDGAITDNYATNGGGMFIFNGTCTMKGGTISNNTAKTAAGGFYDNGTLIVGGSAVITGNTANGTANNVYLYNGKTITLGTDNDAPTTMSIGITLPNKVGQFTTAGTASDYSSNFFSDSDSYKVCFNKGTDEGTTDDCLELRTAYAITNNTKEDYKETNHGYITVDNKAVEGEKVVVTVVANSGYELSSLKYNDGTDHDITSAKSFTMQTTAVSITATFVVAKQTILINETPYTCTYNGEPRAFQITSGEGPMLTGFKFEYYVDDDWTESAPKNAGSYNVKITRPEDDTYKAYEKVIEGGLVIEKAEVEVPTIESKTYTGSTLTADVEISELYEVTENNGGINAGEYNVKLTLTDSVNYKWKTSKDAYVTLTFTISPKEITLEIDDVVAGTYTYDGQAKTTTATYTDLIGDDELSYTLAYSDNINAGTCVVSIASANITKGIATNYNIITSDTGTLVIDKAPLTIKAKDKTIIYNQDPANDGVTYDGFVNGETSAVLGGTLAFEYSYEKGNNAGEYTITPKGLTSNNYDISFVNGKLTVEKIEQVIVINDMSKTYDALVVYASYSKLGDGTVTIEYKLATEDDDKYTTTAPTNAGSYVVRVSVAETETHLSGFTTKEFTISQREVTLTWGETTFAYNNQQQLPTVTAGNLANDDEVTVTVVSNKESVNAGNDYIATATALSNHNYKLPETNLTTNFVINKADYDMTGITFTDKTVKTTDSLEDKKLAISGTLPTGLDGIGLTVSYVDNDNTARGVYTVTAKFSTTSINYNTPSDMTAVLTILWVRDSEKESGSDNEFVIVTSETGIDPTLTLKVDVVKIDNSDSQYKEVTDSIKKEDSFNANLDKIFGVYDVSLIDQNDVKVQPDGTIKVYMTIPEEIKNCEFRIYHIHNGVASKADYVIDDGYAVIETDELSEFVFVYEQTSLLPWIIVLSVISALGLAGIVLLLVKNKKDKQGRE